MICDGMQQQFITLSHPAELLHVPPGRWRSVKFTKASSVLCVLASAPFNKADYIYDYEEFLEWKRKCSSEQGPSGSPKSGRLVSQR
jgi:hypothetical protein